jgi:hypothetical protein
MVNNTFTRLDLFSEDATRRNMKYFALVYGTAAKFDHLAEQVLD